MTKTLVEWLKEIGEEYGAGTLQEDGTIVGTITNDEQLARQIWQRALGYVKNIKQEDGSFAHREILPDPKAQQFIIERREGKYVDPIGDKNPMKALEKINDAIQGQLNTLTEAIVDDSNSDN